MINYIKASKSNSGFHRVYVSGIGIIGQRYIRIPLNVNVIRFKDIMEMMIGDDKVKLKVISIESHLEESKKKSTNLLEISWLIPDEQDAPIINEKIKNSIKLAESHVRSIIRQKISSEKSAILQTQTSIDSNTIKEYLYD